MNDWPLAVSKADLSFFAAALCRGGWVGDHQLGVMSRRKLRQMQFLFSSSSRKGKQPTSKQPLSVALKCRKGNRLARSITLHTADTASDLLAQGLHIYGYEHNIHMYVCMYIYCM